MKQINPPIDNFFNKLGLPLESGYIYIGLPFTNPESNPIQVYYDAELTQPAPQPLRTMNGFIVRNGNPTNIFTKLDDYSIIVKDMDQSLVYNFPNIIEADVIPIGYLIKDFGAVGDGITDDTAVIQAAINSGARIIDGQNLTYLISSQLTGVSDIHLKNIKFVAPNLPTNQYIMEFAGTAGSAQVLGSNVSEGAFSLSVVNGSLFTVNEFIYLESNEYWASASGDNVKYGGLIQIANIAGNVITLNASTLLAYNTSQGATATPITTKKNIKLENISAIGPNSTGDQGGFKFTNCSNVNLININTNNFDFTHLDINKSAKVTVQNGSASGTGIQEGTDYGILIRNGSVDVNVNGYRGDTLRHLVAITGNQGISRHISVENCRINNATDAGIAAYSAVHEHNFVNNFIHFNDDVDITIDGILSKGGAGIINGNQIYNPKRNGITYQPEVLAAFSGPISAIISNNRIDVARNTGINGIIVSTHLSIITKPIESINMASNQVRGVSTGILAQANLAEIRKISITDFNNLSPCLSRSIYINAIGAEINGVSIIGGHHEVHTDSPEAVIDLTGNISFNIRNSRIIGTHLKRGLTGVRGINVAFNNNLIERSTTTDGVTQKTFADAGSVNVSFDDNQAGGGGGGGVDSQRNLIMNPDFFIFQKGNINFPQTSGKYVHADRWILNSVGNLYTPSLQTHDLDSGSFNGTYSKYFHRMAVTNVAGTSNFCRMEQWVEDLRRLQNKQITISFWLKADANKQFTFQGETYYGSTGVNLAAPQFFGITKLNATTSWIQYIITTTVPEKILYPTIAREYGDQDDSACIFRLWFSAGSTFNTQSNTLGAQAGTFDVANFQVEYGPVATAFANPQPDKEMIKCLRYYYALPSSNFIAAGTYADTTANYVTVPFPVPMRKVPIVELITAGTITSNITKTYALFTQDLGNPSISSLRISAEF